MDIQTIVAAVIFAAAIIHAKRALRKEEVLEYLKGLPYTIMDYNQK